MDNFQHLASSIPKSTIKTKYRHIIWDWNGTLFDDIELSVSVINGVLSRRNLQKITIEQYRKMFDFPVEQYYHRLGFDFENESFEKVGTEFITNYEKRRHEAELHSNAREILESIANLGTTQSILSAYKQPTLDELVDYFELRKYFIAVNGLDNHYAHSKIEIGKRWMDELHFGAHEVLLVGDTFHDYEVAEAIGADCVLLTHGHHPKEKLEKTNAQVIESLQNVLKLF